MAAKSPVPRGYSPPLLDRLVSIVSTFQIIRVKDYFPDSSSQLQIDHFGASLVLLVKRLGKFMHFGMFVPCCQNVKKQRQELNWGYSTALKEATISPRSFMQKQKVGWKMDHWVHGQELVCREEDLGQSCSNPASSSDFWRSEVQLNLCMVVTDHWTLATESLLYVPL